MEKKNISMYDKWVKSIELEAEIELYFLTYGFLPTYNKYLK